MSASYEAVAAVPAAAATEIGGTGIPPLPPAEAIVRPGSASSRIRTTGGVAGKEEQPLLPASRTATTLVTSVTAASSPSPATPGGSSSGNPASRTRSGGNGVTMPPLAPMMTLVRSQTTPSAGAAGRSPMVTTSSSVLGGSSSWLLRLFQSQFFNTWIAASYLFKYPDSVGIQHYLCKRLQEFPLEELLFLLPQLWYEIQYQSSADAQAGTWMDSHLAINHPSPSAALENLLMDLCYKSTHATILLSWYLEAYLRELSALVHQRNTSLTEELETCQRMHQQCLNILVQWHPESPQAISARSPKDHKKQVYEYLGPAIVGIGCTMGAMGSTAMTRDGQQMALAQGQRRPSQAWYLGKERRNSWHSGDSLHNTNGNLSPSSEPEPTTSRPVTRRLMHWLGRRRSASIGRMPSRRPVAAPSMEDLHTGNAFSFDRYLIKTKSMQFFETIASPRRSLEKPGGTSKSLIDLSPLRISPLAASPQFPAASTSNFTSRTSVDHAPSRTMADQHYFHSELQFVGALVDISRRLTSVPKSGRQNSLKAELALLNHNFPARVCIPLWCKATHSQPYHHQVVRISPDEAVVLNSADRVPYLILVEVIEADKDNPDGFLNQILASTSVSGGHAGVAAIASRENSPSRADASTMGKSSKLNQSVESSATAASVEAPLIQLQSSPNQPSPAVLPNGVSSNAPTSSNFQEVSLSPTFSATMTPNSARSPRSGDDFQDRMRTAAIMLAQLNDPNSKIPSATQKMIRDRILKEMAAMEEKRMARVDFGRVETTMVMEEQQVSPGGGDPHGDATGIEEQNILKGIQRLKDDPSAAVFKEDYESKMARIRDASPFGKHPNWRLLSVIVKSGADLRQEQLACQLIREMQNIWETEKVDVWVYYYRVLITSDDSGLIETVPNCISVHSIKKDAYAQKLNVAGKLYDLYDYFAREHGPVEGERFANAQQCFLKSLAGYCLVSYILAIKDRHNGNILIDKNGHIIHIDFGFMLSNSPGSVGFESAPFKLSLDYIDILGGTNSPLFAELRRLLVRGLMALRKHADKIILMVEMMQRSIYPLVSYMVEMHIFIVSVDSKFPCFSGNPIATISALRDRFQLSLTEKQVEAYVDQMLASSYNNLNSRLYDAFQYYSNGICV